MSDQKGIKKMIAAVELTIIGVGLCLFFRPDVLFLGLGGLMTLAGLTAVLLELVGSTE